MNYYMKPSWTRIYVINGPKLIGGFNLLPYLSKGNPFRMMLEQDIFI